MSAVTESLIHAAMLGIIALVAIAAGCWAWAAWLRWKRHELATRGAAPVSALPTGARIELAALKERVRQLEAIAQGVDP